MDYFKETQLNLLKSTQSVVRRELFDEIDWSHRLIGIKGFRGVGKTSFLLDYLREYWLRDPKDGLYINLNNFYFTGEDFVVADEFHKKGGKVLILDQIHKYPNWDEELLELQENCPN